MDPIPAERDLRPHITGIALWLPDSRHNRIAHLKFDPRSHAPAPIVTDRWEATGQANLVIPNDTPPGEYTFMFIEHPQFWGTVMVS